MAIDQSKRFLQIHTPLGENKFLLHHFNGHDKLGSLFEYHVDLLSEDAEIDFDKILGKAVTVEMETFKKGVKRYFHGYITEFRYMGAHSHFFRYQAVMRPWLWFLSRTTDCRIYQETSILDIIKDVFADHGFSDFETRLQRTFQNVDYCVQYRETDLNFVSRLMEQEGIYYYFKHENGKHILVLSDNKSSHEDGTIEGKILFRPQGETGYEDAINSWGIGREIVPKEVLLKDWDFIKPKVDLTSSGTRVVSVKNAEPGEAYQIFDYPGEYSEKKLGDVYAKNRIDELANRFHRVQGTGNTREIASGYLFKLAEYPRKDQNAEYLVLSVSHAITCDDGVSTSESGGVISYECQFEATESSTRYRSPRISPKPIVQGPQTAIVVGPEGEEIFTDKYGRIKVLFHWDRLGKKNEKKQNSSCFVRVSTAWAGTNWGSIHIPRMGQEVVVSFLEGDPDRPLVTGSVYNEDHMPPYTLVDNKTQSGIKSRSTKKGTDKNFNEIRFEDKKDEEEFRIQAEKDMNIGVKNIRKTFIGASLKVDGDGDKEDCPAVGEMNEQLTVFADRETFIKGNDTLQIAEESKASKGRCMTVHNGNHELTVEKGNQKTAIKMGNKTTTVKQGNYDIDVKLGKITVKAMQSIELIVGMSKIKIEPAKITLKSVKVDIQADAMATVKGPMVEVNGSGTAMLKGGVVMIN